MPSCVRPGIVIRRAEFGADPVEDEAGDGFARRQDALSVLNDELSEADEAAAKSLEAGRAAFFAGEGDPVFAAPQKDLFAERRKRLLADLPDPASRDEATEAFDQLAERHLRRATALEQDARVRARAAGAERAFQRLTQAAVVDPDGLLDRLTDAETILGRMVEAGTDPAAAAERARAFRNEIGSAVLDSLAERDPHGALARLDNGTFDGVLDDEDKLSTRERLAQIAKADDEASGNRAALAQRSAELDRAADRRAKVQELTRGLSDGTIDQGHIARAVYRGDVEESDAEQLRKRLAELTDLRMRRAEEIDRFDTAVRGDAAFLGPNRWDPEIVDEWWRAQRDYEARSPDLIPDCFGKSGQIPRPYIDDLRALVLSASPEESVTAGREFRALRQASPAAAEAVFAELPQKEAGTLSMLAEYAHLDLPAERIRELAEEEHDRRDDLSRLDAIRPQTDENASASGSELPDDSADEELAEAGTGSNTNSETLPLPPPTYGPVDLDEMHRVLNYNPDGAGDIGNAFNRLPSETKDLLGIKNEALQKTAEVQREFGLSPDEANAFQHAYWSYRMTEQFGPKVAKEIGDGHERSPAPTYPGASGPNPVGDSLMDLYNNRVGRDLAAETTDGQKNPPDVVLDALASGKLQTRPFNLTRRNK